MTTGTLYTVATPIGNLDDFTPRAIKTLQNVDYILCEDKRVSSKLLSHFGISKKLVAYHKFNEKEQLDAIVADIEQGQNVALISDAGTPCISDPGRILVNELYKKNIKVSPISGACAVSTLLSAAPKEDETYTFIGFLPRTSQEQEKIFQQYSTSDIVFYESPNRILKTLENIIKIYGKGAKVTIGRELTKLFEEIKTGTAKELLDYYTQKQPKGEIAAILYKTATNTDSQDLDLANKIKQLKQKGYSAKDTATILSTLFEVNKNVVYKLACEL